MDKISSEDFSKEIESKVSEIRPLLNGLSFRQAQSVLDTLYASIRDTSMVNMDAPEVDNDILKSFNV